MPPAVSLPAGHRLLPGPVRAARLPARPDPAAERPLRLPGRHDLRQRPVRAAEPVPAGRDQPRRHLLLPARPDPAEQPVPAVLVPGRPGSRHRSGQVRAGLVPARPGAEERPVRADHLQAERGPVQRQVRAEVPGQIRCTPCRTACARQLALRLPDGAVQRPVRAAVPARPSNTRCRTGRASRCSAADCRSSAWRRRNWSTASASIRVHRSRRAARRHVQVDHLPPLQILCLAPKELVNGQCVDPCPPLTDASA